MQLLLVENFFLKNVIVDKTISMKKVMTGGQKSKNTMGLCRALLCGPKPNYSSHHKNTLNRFWAMKQRDKVKKNTEKEM